MDSPHGIIIFGANGSGKTTLGKELAKKLNYKHMDIEDYHFIKSDIPYTITRSKEECFNLIINDIKIYNSFIISAVTGDFLDEISSLFELAIYIDTPKELRIQRVAQRGYDLHGNRVRIGGDMYGQQQQFLSFVANRSHDHISHYASTLSCPIIAIDGTKSIDENINLITARFYTKK